MLPKPRPNLKGPYDQLSAARLKVAISVAFCVLDKFSNKIEGNEAFFIYNSWRHICRIMRECKYSPTDHIKRCIVYGWVNGCCNISSPMSIHTGPTYMITESVLWDFEGFVGPETLYCDEVKIRFRVSEAMDCYWIFIYISNIYAASFRYYKTKNLVHVHNNLRRMCEEGGLFCVESSGHFYCFSDLLDLLESGKSCYPVNLPMDLYLGKRKEVVLIRRWKSGEALTLEDIISKKKRHELMPSDERIDSSICQLGEYGLIHLLGLKFDHRTAVILSNYARDYWDGEELASCSLIFLIESNDSRQICKYIDGLNWKRKRFCSDVCHILHFSGYPRLWYYDKNIPTSKVGRIYLLCCKNDKRNHFIVEKGKEDYKDFLKKKRRNLKCFSRDPITKEYIYPEMKVSKYMEKMVTYNKREQNSFITKDRVYNTMKKCMVISDTEKQKKVMEEKLPGLVKMSESKIMRVFDKLDYVKALTSDMRANTIAVAKNIKEKKLTNIISTSLENCKRLKEDLKKYEVEKRLIKEEWQNPKKPYPVRATLGREEIVTTSENIFHIIENFETENLEVINEIEKTNSTPHNISDVKQVVAANIINLQNIYHKKKRMERENNIERITKKSEDKINKLPVPLNREMEEMNYKFITSKGGMSTRIKELRREKNKFNSMKNDDRRKIKKINLTELNNQFRSKRVKKIRDVKFLWQGAKTGEFEPLHFIAFPKIEVMGDHEPRGPWKWDTTKKITNSERPYWMTLRPDELKEYNKARDKEKKKRKKEAKKAGNDYWDELMGPLSHYVY